MTEQERELDMMVAELEQENRLLRARNERLEAEQAQKQEPVAKKMLTDCPFCMHTFEVTASAFTSPPQRQPWTGLTKKEVYDLYDSDYAVFHQRIEAKLKEKNT